jgi:hypothetical protein
MTGGRSVGVNTSTIAVAEDADLWSTTVTSEDGAENPIGTAGDVDAFVGEEPIKEFDATGIVALAIAGGGEGEGPTGGMDVVGVAGACGFTDWVRAGTGVGRASRAEPPVVRAGKRRRLGLPIGMFVTGSLDVDKVTRRRSLTKKYNKCT